MCICRICSVKLNQIQAFHFRFQTRLISWQTLASWHGTQQFEASHRRIMRYPFSLWEQSQWSQPKHVSKSGIMRLFPCRVELHSKSTLLELCSSWQCFQSFAENSKRNHLPSQSLFTTVTSLVFTVGCSVLGAAKLHKFYVIPFTVCRIMAHNGSIIGPRVCGTMTSDLMSAKNVDEMAANLSKEHSTELVVISSALF